MSPQHTGERGPGASLLGPRLLAFALLLLSVVILYGSFQIRQAGGYSPIGTRFFPILVGIGTLLLSGLFLLRTTVMPDEDLAREAAAEDAATDWRTVGLVALALIAYPFALGWLGYVLATALFVPLASIILGSRNPRRDIVVGIFLGLIIYFGFTRFLGVRLPAAPLDFLQ